MAIQVSPGVNTSEIDLTTIVPTAAGVSTGGIAGVFNWGPVNQPTLVNSEVALLDVFGPPTSDNAETWFSAANFLAYGNSLWVNRVANTSSSSATIGAWNALATASGTKTGNVNFNIQNGDDYVLKSQNFNSADATVFWIAKTPGSLGNSLRISVCDTANQYSSNLTNVTATTFQIGNTQANLQFETTGNWANAAWYALTVGDFITVGNSSVGFQTMQVTGKGDTTPGTGNNFIVNLASAYTLSKAVSMTGNIGRLWQYYNTVKTAPGRSTHQSTFGNTTANDELHIIVADQLGGFTGTPGQVLEVWEGLSRATDAQSPDGASIYYANVINMSSKYVWYGNPRYAGYNNTAINITSLQANTPYIQNFSNGNNGSTESNVVSGDYSTIINGWNAFNNPEVLDVSLLISGKTANVQTANYIIDNVANVRKDCMVFISPRYTDVVPSANSTTDQTIGTLGQEVNNLLNFRNNVSSSSYAFLDSGYKYQYDKYNDVYRWIPLNGDIAGLCAMTDLQRDPWWSPAGFNRGQIKNVVRLAYNPNKGARDTLYSAGINPVVSFAGQGTILYGDKTLSAKSSAFDRINVRRLFIILEKAISQAAKYYLFDFNDEFTRSQFISLVTPYLKDIQGRRGIYDFRVVCDATNNTQQVIDSNRFVGDIYVKPARAINFIQLNFVAARTGVAFSEIVGKF